jgi:multiple sugar transport system ATP-binding protein
MSSLEIRGLNKNFGAVKALQNVSLNITDGEFVIILGPTGAGKTTTLRCVAGLEKLDGGDVTMDGVSLKGCSPAERDVALVFQSYALYPRKTVMQNMAFPLQARKLPTEVINRTVREIAAKLNIEQLLERRPAQLSGGQQQRVALGRAMVRRPRLFLMDEPLTNLDFKLRVEMRSELKRLQKEMAATFFYVTNDQVEAMSMADRIAVLNQGVLQQVDTPENVYMHPANQFVAGFVGNPRMNFMACHFDPQTNSLIGQENIWTMPLTVEQRRKIEQLSGAKDYIFGIRAEEIELASQNSSDVHPGEVYVVEPLGDRVLLDVRLGKEMVKVKLAATEETLTGDRVWLRFNPQRFHLFDRATGTTLF